VKYLLTACINNFEGSRSLGRDRLLEAEWGVFVAVALEELVLEFDPVQAQRVQRALQQVHAHNDAQDHAAPDCKAKHHAEGRSFSNLLSK